MKRVIIVGINHPWGTPLSEFIESKGYKVEFYIDSYANHPKVKTIKPDEVGEYIKDPENYLFLFTFPLVGYRVEVLEKIKAQLGEKFEWWDYKKVYKEFKEVFSVIDNHYWFDNNYKIECKEDILKLFEEDKSKRIVNNWIEFRKTHNGDFIEDPEEGQYIPEDINIMDILPKSYNFIDVGAYDGDTLELFLSKGKNFGKNMNIYVGFEPDKRNFSNLLKRIQTLRQDFPDTVYIPIMAGCGDCFDVLNLYCDVDNGSISRLTQIPGIDLKEFDFTQKVFIMKPDDTFINLGFHLIKMDTEGYELPCLKGMQRIIREYKPILMVSLYHKPEDLYEIPKFIKQIDPTYRLYVRVHGTFFMETVLYALPSHG